MKNSPQLSSCAWCLFVMALLVPSFAALSQITISSSDLQAAYAVGATYEGLWDSADVVVTIGTASGTAQEWDFRAYNYAFLNTGTSIPPQDSPVFAEFPTSNFAFRNVVPPTQGLDSLVSYQHLNLGPIELLLLGFGDGVNPPTKNSPPVPELRFPCTYGSSWNYVAKPDTTEIAGFFFITQTTQNTVIDAFGTLRLPEGDFQALRRKVERIRSSTSNIPFYPSTTTYTYTYEFMTLSQFTAVVSVDSAQQALATVTTQGISYTRPATGTSVERSNQEIPEQFSLAQNYPNPFNPSTTFNFDVPRAARVTLSIYDLLGKKVEDVVDVELSPGAYSAKWQPEGLASGVYLYRLSTGDQFMQRKLILLR